MPLVVCELPVFHTTVTAKRPLQKVLSEKMFLGFLFDNSDAPAGTGRGPHNSALGVHWMFASDDTLAPRTHVKGFTNDVRWLRKPELGWAAVLTEPCRR